MATPLEGCMTFAVTAGKQLSGMSHSLLWSPPCVYMCVCVRACVCVQPESQFWVASLVRSQASTAKDPHYQMQLLAEKSIIGTITVISFFCPCQPPIDFASFINAWVHQSLWKQAGRCIMTVRMYLYRNIYMYIHINATADLHCQVFSV